MIPANSGAMSAQGNQEANKGGRDHCESVSTLQRLCEDVGRQPWQTAGLSRRTKRSTGKVWHGRGSGSEVERLSRTRERTNSQGCAHDTSQCDHRDGPLLATMHNWDTGRKRAAHAPRALTSHPAEPTPSPATASVRNATAHTWPRWSSRGRYPASSRKVAAMPKDRAVAAFRSTRVENTCDKREVQRPHV